MQRTHANRITDAQRLLRARAFVLDVTTRARPAGEAPTELHLSAVDVVQALSMHARHGARLQRFDIGERHGEDRRKSIDREEGKLDGVQPTGPIVQRQSIEGVDANGKGLGWMFRSRGVEEMNVELRIAVANGQIVDRLVRFDVRFVIDEHGEECERSVPIRAHADLNGESDTLILMLTLISVVARRAETSQLRRLTGHSDVDRYSVPTERSIRESAASIRSNSSVCE